VYSFESLPSIEFSTEQNTFCVILTFLFEDMRFNLAGFCLLYRHKNGQTVETLSENGIYIFVKDDKLRM